MGEQKISSLVTGGGASAGPPLGPALGPLGVNIMEVIQAINNKTKDFEGMKVPVTVIVNTDTKKYDIEIGIPSAAALIMKEGGNFKRFRSIRDRMGWRCYTRCNYQSSKHKT